VYIPVLRGGDRAALRIFRWLRISSLARLIIVDADADDADGEGKVAAFMMLFERVAFSLALVRSHLITSAEREMTTHIHSKTELKDDLVENGSHYRSTRGDMETDMLPPGRGSDMYS
jgi:hypothetical protein